MEERDPHLPVATLRPRRIDGRVLAWRGALGRWLHDKVRGGLLGRHAPFILTGIVFSGMMLAMGYVADRANRAADAIDEMHRMQRAKMAYDRAQEWARYDLEVATQVPVEQAPADPWPVAKPDKPAPTPLFYVRGGR